jgi:FMN-dependent NADH-azoreductase
MAQLLHIDSSVRGDVSVSRRLGARAAERWLATHPGGTVTYRDLAVAPIPHVDATTVTARLVPADQRKPAQEEAVARIVELVEEVKNADAVLLGLPLYNFGAPSTVKAWVDHIVAPGLSIDPESGAGLLGGTDFIVLGSRGHGFGPCTPHEGWDHESWLSYAVSRTGLQPRFITAELTLADVDPAMADLKSLAAESLARALQAIDRLWTAADIAV